MDIDGGDEDPSDSDIHFGMKDVESRIDAATKQIRDHFVTSYGQISGQMLGQLAENTAVSDDMRRRLNDRANVELVLGRVGDNVSDAQKALILGLLDNGTLTSNHHLSFFLSRLIEAYDQVKSFDMSLQAYARVCNGYLINKSLKYDSLAGTLKLYEHTSNNTLDLEHLSSGEKQILGVMSGLYLGSQASYAVIFDEPELSLSVEWQKKILVDIVSSSNCRLLVAATHSPFVFDNELDACARALNVSYRVAGDGARAV